MADFVPMGGACGYNAGASFFHQQRTVIICYIYFLAKKRRCVFPLPNLPGNTGAREPKGTCRAHHDWSPAVSENGSLGTGFPVRNFSKEMAIFQSIW
ncbi:MAG: hypothetical protein ACOX1X_01305 [Dethiobacteria bacterium]